MQENLWNFCWSFTATSGLQPSSCALGHHVLKTTACYRTAFCRGLVSNKPSEFNVSSLPMLQNSVTTKWKTHSSGCEWWHHRKSAVALSVPEENASGPCFSFSTHEWRNTPVFKQKVIFGVLWDTTVKSVSVECNNKPAFLLRCVLFWEQKVTLLTTRWRRFQSLSTQSVKNNPEEDQLKELLCSRNNNKKTFSIFTDARLQNIHVYSSKIVASHCVSVYCTVLQKFLWSTSCRLHVIFAIQGSKRLALSEELCGDFLLLTTFIIV